MNTIYQIAFLAFLGACFRVGARVSNKSLTDIAITTYIVFCGSVIITGFVLSELHLTNMRRAWAIGVFIPAFIFYLQFTKLFGRERRENFTLFEIIGERFQAFFEWAENLNKFLKSIFTLLFLTFIILFVTNLLLILNTPPNEWDSMTGHLVRVVYYLQHSTMDHFGGTNWNIDTYPKSICNIQIYSYLMSGKKEIFFKFIHFSAYLICIISAYGIAQRIGKNFTASVFCALIMALLPNVLVQAISTETDLVLCSYLSCLIYFLLTYRQSLKRRYLYLAGITIGMALGHKITFLLLAPSVFVIICYALLWEENWKKLLFLRLKHLTFGTLIGVCFLTLPTGYLKNMQLYGHPIGPKTALQHQSIERAGNLKGLVREGSRNVARYFLDFCNLDGIRNSDLGNQLNKTLKTPLVYLENRLKLGLISTTNFTILPFSFDRRFEFYNANPYYGIFGIGLIFPLMFLVVVRRKRSTVLLFFALAFVLHFLTLSFSAAYDPWKGRYFQNSAVFAIPFLVSLFKFGSRINKKGFNLIKLFTLVVTFLGCISAIMTVFLNERSLPFQTSTRKSAFNTERIEFMTWARPDITKAYQKFDQLVPAKAVVALADINDDFEYPLFGSNLSRILIPINPFEKGLQPIPKNAEYLFFSKSVIKPNKKDIRLGTDTLMQGLITKGEDFYLRKLK